jgi:hypothetical protein
MHIKVLSVSDSDSKVGPVHALAFLSEGLKNGGSPTACGRPFVVVDADPLATVVGTLIPE